MVTSAHTGQTPSLLVGESVEQPGRACPVMLYELVSPLLGPIIRPIAPSSALRQPLGQSTASGHEKTQKQFLIVKSWMSFIKVVNYACDYQASVPGS